MNVYQRVWWDQVKSEHDILIIMRHSGANPCHQLHYLQMVTEKLGKAYFWRDLKEPRKTHAMFVRFLRGLNDRRESERANIAQLLGFGGTAEFESGLSRIYPLAHAVERLAPAFAGDTGPNPEYPWPIQAPIHSPAMFDFDIWKDLNETGPGRRLLKVIDAAVLNFPRYA